MVMKRPNLNKLLTLLRIVRDRGPTNFSGIVSAYGRPCSNLVERYTKFCLERGLIRVSRVFHGRGRYPSKEYVITPKGLSLLRVFEEV